MGDPTNDVNLDECYEVAKEMAKIAGGMILEAVDVEKRVECKSSIDDLVTATDKEVEEYIKSTIKEIFPSHSFIGEESVAAGARCNLTDNPTWIVDPIDGTTNFVHRFPFCAVSIGLLVSKRPAVAVVYNPQLDELYTARSGKGAFCNERKLAVANTAELSRALICAEHYSSVPEKFQPRVRTISKIAQGCQGIRTLGSSALNLCSVAAGRTDGYVEMGLHCWDMAAAALIVTEAGGVLRSPKGGEFDLMSRSVLCAATPALADQLLPLIEYMDFGTD